MTSEDLSNVVGKYFVSQFNEGSLISNVEISKEEYDDVSAANLSIRRIQFYKNKGFECILNKKECIDKIAEYRIILNDKTKDLKKFNHEFARMDINRVFNNFVISFKSLMEHSEKMIIRHYTKNSFEYKEFKEFSSHYYDKLFSYRLFIRLRNYTIHYSQAISLKIDFNPLSSILLFPHLRKSELLRFKEIAQKHSSDLAIYNEDIPIEPLIQEIDEYLNIYYPVVVRILANTENTNIQILLNFYRKYIESKSFAMSLGAPNSYVDGKLDMNFVSLDISDALVVEEILH